MCTVHTCIWAKAGTNVLVGVLQGGDHSPLRPALPRPRADPPLFQVPRVELRLLQGQGQARPRHRRRRRVLVGQDPVGTLVLKIRNYSFRCGIRPYKVVYEECVMTWRALAQ
jgi:hypothetical protein